MITGKEGINIKINWSKVLEIYKCIILTGIVIFLTLTYFKPQTMSAQRVWVMGGNVGVEGSVDVGSIYSTVPVEVENTVNVDGHVEIDGVVYTDNW